MAKNSFPEWSTTANSNTDVGGINIAEGCPPSNINNAIREVMAQLRSGVDPGFLLSTKAANYTAIAGDEGAWLRFTASATLSLTAAATLLANWYVFVQADGGNVIIDPNAAETINGLATINLKDGEAAYVICDGTTFRAYRFSAPASYVVKTANYTALDTDYNASIRFTTAATLAFDVTANLRSNWRINVWNDTTGLVPIDPDSTNTINGATTLVLQSGQRAEIFKTAATTFQANVFGDPLSGPQLQGYITGLTLANNATDGTNDIDIAIGAASSSQSPYYLMSLASALTKRLDASWSVGNNQGGLDTGSIANGTYHTYLIRRSDTGVVDACFSASASAPTTGGNIPAAYDQYRRIGSFIRESAAIVTFVQDGDDFFYKSPTTEVTALNPGTAAVTRTLRVPLGIRVTALPNVVVRNSTAAGQWIAYISDLSLDDLAPGLTGPLSNAGTGNIDNRQGQQVIVKTNTSGQVRSRLFASDANTTLFIATTGWIDRRGKN